MKTQRLSARPRLILLMIAVLAGLLAMLPAVLNVRVAEYDEAIFLDVARNIQRSGLPLRSIGEQGVLFFDPLFVYLLSLYASPSAAGLLAARLVTALFGVGCVVLTFLVGERSSSTLGGFLAALLLAINPFFAEHAFFVRMEIPMVFAMLAGLFLLGRSQACRGAAVWLATGVALAIAVLLKEVALVFAACCVIYVVLSQRSRGGWFWKGALVGLPCLMARAGWAAWCWKLSPSVFTGTIQLWLGTAVSGNSFIDPRSLTTAGQWARQLTLDLFGPTVVGALAVSLVLSFRVRHLQPPRNSLRFILWLYLVLALVISFLLRLKELRHLIGTIPVAALLIGGGVDWQAIWAGLRARRGTRAAMAVTVLALFLFSASPLRLPIWGVSGPGAWLDPLYAQRILGNDRLCNVLRLAGLYIQERTDPAEVVTVAHEGTVVGYYADRRYNLLYPLTEDVIMQILQRSRYLVWDDPVFLALDRSQIQVVEAYIAEHFAEEGSVSDAYRQVKIYVRRNPTG